MKYAFQMMWAALAEVFGALYQGASAINGVATTANVAAHRLLKEEAGDIEELKKLQEDLKSIEFLNPTLRK